MTDTAALWTATTREGLAAFAASEAGAAVAAATPASPLPVRAARVAFLWASALVSDAFEGDDRAAQDAAFADCDAALDTLAGEGPLSALEGEALDHLARCFADNLCANSTTVPEGLARILAGEAAGDVF